MNLSYEIILSLTFVISFLVTYLSVPSVVSVAKQRKLFDEPNSRKSHVQKIPTLGGVTIFAGFTTAAGSFISYSLVPSLQYILVACIIMFFIGLEDDILAIAPLKKLLGQIAAALVLIFPGNLYFTSIHGFSGIYYIPDIAGMALTLFVIIVVVNSLI